MIRYYALDGHGLRGNDVTAAAVLPRETLWIDLLEPTVEEELKVERDLGIDVPTREEMREIETSNRLYEEGDALYMTATVVTKLDTDRPTSDQITFILTPDRLITNRYVDPLPFRRYVAYAEKHSAQCNTAPAILAGLLESIVNRIADVLERIGTDMDTLSNEVFASNGTGLHRSRDFRLVLERVGRNGDLVSKARETLASLGRLVVFLQQTNHPQIQNDARNRLRTLGRDIAQMSDHATFIGNKVQFMLDATLGMINIDQNNILKIFSVVTLIMLPPSVIGGIFGMNFAVIPFSQHPFGFELAIGLMVLSAVTPFVMFKRRGWL